MSTENVVQLIENDEFYGQFLKNNSKALSESLAFTEQVRKLGEGIETLNKELQKQVLENHDDLLRQANHATKLENVLSIMNMHIQSLFANAERLKTQITVSYEQLEAHTKVLGHLHKASHILRQVSRIQQLSKRLANTSDPLQKATLLQELEQLAGDSELTDVDIITTELRNIRIQQQKVIKLAAGSLNQGIINENLIQTTTALQIFINLGVINDTVNNFIKQNIDECRDIIKSALDVNISTSINKSKGGSGRMQFNSSQGFSNKLWNELEKCFSGDIYQICKQVKFFQITINELHLSNIDKNLANKFWTDLGKIIQEEINQSSVAVQQILETDYPKLLKKYYDMANKLNYKQFKFDRFVLKRLENSYLSSSLTKILEPVEDMFKEENNIPNHDEIDSLIRIMSSELSVALIEENLSEQVSKNIGKCIKMFNVKIENKIESGPESAQVIGGTANTGQQKNVQYANILYYLKTQIHRTLINMKESLPESSATIINENLESINGLTGSIIEPLIVSINSVIETILVTMHLEPDWLKIQVVANKNLPCSPYMKELIQFITRVYNTYLVNFHNKEVLSEKCNIIAIKCIDLLVRHSAILRPVGQGGRHRLQSDYHHLEEALKVICPNLTNLGRPYRLLKSMASLIIQTPEDIIAGQVSGSSVPHSTILFMLFSFANLELASPHQNTGWSLPKLSTWLDEHPNETERLDLVAGALQKYESMVRQKNSTNYDPVYPLMSNFLEMAVKEIKH
ncbi:conserved oligomeric Golgi complex subunit 5 [Sitophilus oryzae]|uniref:Conserved oligomeric Golgi complex subunit 5 n=1 Tax=Sitophilus oryzae TaxID=7048 RepID=A0A6J2XK92_SITOR|nr:conserved oligomeric Golgi complex subunit 5 [Sitophilus oryzae]